MINSNLLSNLFMYVSYLLLQLVFCSEALYAIFFVHTWLKVGQGVGDPACLLYLDIVLELIQVAVLVRIQELGRLAPVKHVHLIKGWEE